NEESYGAASCRENCVDWYSQNIFEAEMLMLKRFLSSEDPPPSESDDGHYRAGLVNMLPAVVEIIALCGTLRKLLPSARRGFASHINVKELVYGIGPLTCCFSNMDVGIRSEETEEANYPCCTVARPP
ncbi:hypothetical protein D5086_016479, partial [Populus alba]